MLCSVALLITTLCHVCIHQLSGCCSLHDNSDDLSLVWIPRLVEEVELPHAVHRSTPEIQWSEGGGTGCAVEEMSNILCFRPTFLAAVGGVLAYSLLVGLQESAVA